MCDYCECEEFGKIIWNNNIPIITSGEGDVDVSDCWIIRGSDVVAWPKRKDGGVTIKNRRDDDSLSIASVFGFERRLMDINDKFYVYSSHDRFLVADAIITKIMADENHGDIHFYLTLKVSLYLPDDKVKLFTEMVEALHDVDDYGTQTTVSLDVERTQESFDGPESVFLGVGESPLEDKFYNSLPARIQSIIDAQYHIGNYRADFVIESNRLVIEIDGHDYHSSMEQIKRDKEREKFIMSQGWRVVRFTGKEIFKDMNKVIKSIDSCLLIATT